VPEATPVTAAETPVSIIAEVVAVRRGRDAFAYDGALARGFGPGLTAAVNGLFSGAKGPKTGQNSQ
jgi:hypothetical protein